MKKSFSFSGQNKNNMFIWYFMWRILNNLHEEVEYSFMIAGHTKFSCDRFEIKYFLMAFLFFQKLMFFFTFQYIIIYNVIYI